MCVLGWRGCGSHLGAEMASVRPVFVDLEELPGSAEVQAEVCIVGAGAAGITIARELSGRDSSVVLLEGGGLKLEPATQALYQGESVGFQYEDLEAARCRYFGGSTNPEGWGGWCKPLAPLDFEHRSWVPHSGWPITFKELMPWYTRANAVCEAGPFDYDLQSWQRCISESLHGFAFDGHVVTELSQLSPPTRFGLRYRDELSASANVHVYLHANAMEIVTDGDGSTATYVKARSLGGQSLTVACRFVVLAAGGIENARLLLLSRGSTARGLGNDNDLVGRFFMDHPRLDLGTIQLSEGSLPRLFDPYYKWHSRKRSLRGVYDESLVAASFTLSPKAQRSEALLNYRAWVVETYPGEGTTAVEALKRLYVGYRSRALPATWRNDLARVARKPHFVAASAVGRLFRPRWLVREHRLVNILEAEPMPDSRISLGDQLDVLGVPKVRLDWRVGNQVRRTLASAHMLLDEQLRASGLGRVVNPFQQEDEVRFRSALRWVWHHMGTTRMSADPVEGVVDADCRVHATSNVYVAGSSVFATAGNDMPTLTIVALALRLADHLSRQLDGASS